jgi:hypothetical protein
MRVYVIQTLEPSSEPFTEIGGIVPTVGKVFERVHPDIDLGCFIPNPDYDNDNYEVSYDSLGARLACDGYVIICDKEGPFMRISEEDI